MTTPERRGFPIVVLAATADGKAWEEMDRYEDATLARKAIRGYPVGQYNIVRVLDEGIHIKPPAPVTENVVEWGVRHLTRGGKDDAADEPESAA